MNATNATAGAFRQPPATGHSLLRRTMLGERCSHREDTARRASARTQRALPASEDIDGRARHRDRAVVKIRRGVDVTAHRQALLLRVGAVAVVAAGGLVSVATPAFAAGITIEQPGSVDLNAGA